VTTATLATRQSARSGNALAVCGTFWQQMSPAPGRKTRLYAGVFWPVAAHLLHPSWPSSPGDSGREQRHAPPSGIALRFQNLGLRQGEREAEHERIEGQAECPVRSVDSVQPFRRRAHLPPQLLGGCSSSERTPAAMIGPALLAVGARGVFVALSFLSTPRARPPDGFELDFACGPF
jgi:hypothetical protein